MILKKLNNLSAENPLGMIFYRTIDEAGETLRLKLFHAEQTIALSDVLPILENMGLELLVNDLMN